MITIKGLEKRFDDRVVLSDINLTFEPGKIYALVGQSGSGKTTLLNIMAKLETYDSGQVIYRDRELGQVRSQDYFRNHLGYLFQNFGLLENESISINLDLGLVGQKLTKTERLTCQKEALDQVNLAYLDLNQKIYALSGGEAQRVALAKVLLKNPSLILADEPTAALDPKNSDEVMSILEGFRQPDRLIIIATHNPLIWERADLVIRMEEL